MSNINMSIYHDAGFSSSEMRSLERLLEENSSIHWIKLNSQTSTYEMVLDNSLMSCFRSCPSLFMLTWIEGYTGNGRSWILEFGTLFHKMIEIYYENFRKPSFNMLDWAVNHGAYEWHKANMDAFGHIKEFTTLGGVKGFCTLLAAYATRFSADNERLRVIGTEISFGRNREVLLGSLITKFDTQRAYLNAYLAGRIDVLIDDRESICPLDHKTKGTLRNDPSKFYEVDEGPTGYIFAINAILPNLIKALNLENALLQRNCNKILMNYISKTPTNDPNERFRRLPIMKTQDQLESYRRRMLNTSEDIFRALIRYASTKEASRNTGICTNHYGSDCGFLAVHRQSSKENELITLNSFYVKKPIWNTEEVSNKGDINDRASSSTADVDIQTS